MAAPAWAPSVAQVAAYVPHRTLVRSATSTTESQDQYELTFTDDTLPTDLVVAQLVADGCAWVTAVVAPLNTAVYPLAALVAALWAAIAVERSWPDDDQSLQRAGDMEKQLNVLLAQLRAADAAANATAGTDPSPPPVMPRWSFPCPDQRWDYPDYW